MAMWSVNTWIIVACVAVFVIDGFVPPKFWKPTIVSEDLAADVTLDVIRSNPRYAQQVRPDQAAQQFFEATIVDLAEGGQVVGTVVYQRMPPLKRMLHFSVALTFLQPLHVFEFWRFIGFQFLHGSVVHLLLNMLGLYFFGPLVEQALGRKRYLAFYLLCGIFGAMMYLLLNLGGFVVGEIFQQPIRIPGLLFNSPYTPLIGASAGVFGVLMAGAYLAPNVTVLVMFILPMRLSTVAYLLVIMALYTLITGGANAGGEAGHLGGAIAGWYFIRHPRHLHGFFDLLGRADPTSHHYRARGVGGDRRGGPPAAPDRTEIDRILDKISTKGLGSLSEREKRLLREASER
jgi:membrane associated rhomboid family serine protease